MILVSQSKQDVIKMLRHLAEAAAKYGLKLHFGKTKILTWNHLAHPATSVDIDGQTVAILDESCSERYLGRKLVFNSSQDVEIDNRIACGWAAFTKHRSELCCKLYPLRDRIRLFDAVITPAVLYASSTWALTRKMELKLQVTWRRMLRYIFRIYRRKTEGVQEDWVEYMHRATQRIKQLSDELGMMTWVEMHRREKWRLAGKLVRTTDDRWSRLVLDWQPYSGVGRTQGHPCTRWTDQLENFAGGDWKKHAEDEVSWSIYEDAFVQHCG